MFIDIVKKVFRVTKAVTQKRQAVVDVRHHAVRPTANYRGQHTVDYELCIGCDSCNKICPVHAITMQHLPLKKQNIVPEVNLAVCIFCGLCEDVCPTTPDKAIKLSGGRFDMLTGGLHANQQDFWVHADIPQSYIDSRLEEEEAARVKKELAKTKREAIAAAKKAEEAAKKAEDNNDGAQK